MKSNRDLINQFFGGISSSALDYLTEHFKEIEFASKSLLVRSGDVAKYFYIVKTGVQAIYLVDKKGDKVVLGFSYQGSVSGVYDSFLLQRPSTYYLEALTLSELLAIDLTHYQLFFEKFPEMKDWRIQFIENVFFGRGDREVEFLTQNAKSRFDAFMKRCPKELLTIPQKYLASYLNMKPETFSRLRALRD